MKPAAEAAIKTVVTMEAVIYRADGTVEDLGEIARSEPVPAGTKFVRLRGLVRKRDGKETSHG